MECARLKVSSVGRARGKGEETIFCGICEKFIVLWSKVAVSLLLEERWQQNVWLQFTSAGSTRTSDSKSRAPN